MPGIAIVAGADGCGFGTAAALRLAETGADVALWAADPAGWADTVARVTALGRRALAIGTDVTDATSVGDALAVVCDRLGDPRVLVNVVEAAVPGPLSGLSEPDWYASTGARLRGVFLASRAVVDPMIRNMSGRIVTIAGPHGSGGGGGGGRGATLAAGLAGFTRTVAAELEPFGITANLVRTAHADPALPTAVLAFLVGEDAVSGQVVHIGASAT